MCVAGRSRPVAAELPLSREGASAGRSAGSRIHAARGSSNSDPLVVAVILNWNGREETTRCVASLQESGWGRLITIVVDNASDENIEGRLLERFPDVRFVQNATNRGFAGGMNAGVVRARDY